jgi:hypothetical protein
MQRGFYLWVIGFGFAMACSAAANDEGGVAGGGGGPAVGGAGASGGASSGGGGGISLGGGGAAGSSGGGAGDGAASGGAAGQIGCQSDGGGATGPGGAGSGGPEVCGNGLDDNANGFVDEGCSCTAGSTQPCYGGPAWAAAKGKCAQAVQQCSTTGEFPQWGPCTGWVPPTMEVCEGSVDEDCDGQVDESCGCCNGDVQPCGVQEGACTPGSHTCANGKWGDCQGGVMPQTEICGNKIDDDCDGQIDEGCTIDLPVNINGDCVTATCPPQAPYAVGCQITMAGNDARGCVANNGGPVVYFQEGDKCGAGKVTGTLLCSSQPGAPLSASNCAINKSTKYYPTSKAGCPAT